MATTGTGNFAELLWPGIMDIFGETYDNWNPLYKQFFDTRMSDKAFEKAQGVTTLPLAGIKTEGSNINYVGPRQGPQKEYVNVTYALGADVTLEMYEDDQYDYINDLPAMLAESMQVTEETIAHNVLNNGFSTQTSADGLSVFNASHPDFGEIGGTQRNTPATQADLTQASLEQALIDISDWNDDQGKPKRAMATTLIVPTALQFTAQKILETAYEVNTNNNTINPVQGKVKLVVTPYLTDNDAWFLVTNVRKGLTWFDRRSATIGRENEFDTDNLKFKVSRRFSTGVTDWRGVYGTSGNGS